MFEGFLGDIMTVKVRTAKLAAKEKSREVSTGYENNL